MNRNLFGSFDEADVARALREAAQDIQMSASFERQLEDRLIASHKAAVKPARGLGSRLIPSVGWALLAAVALILLNTALPAMVPGRGANLIGPVNFESAVRDGVMCEGRLAALHGFSVSVTSPDKTRLIELDPQREIGELRSISWSPDGLTLAAIGNTNGGGRIYFADPDNDMLSVPHPGWPFGYLEGLAWSWDGEEILTWELNNNRRLYFINAESGASATGALSVQFFETPQFTPDNQAVMFYGADEAADGLFQVKRNGANGTQVLLISDLVAGPRSLAWSPRGNRLAYMEMDRNLGEARLVIQDSSNTIRTVIAMLPIPKGSGSSLPQAANLSWSPDGNLLVFEFGRNSSDRAVHLAFADGSGQVLLAQSAHAPAISADGRCLAYINGREIFLLDLAAAVTPQSGTASSPVRLADLPAGRGRTDFQMDRLQWQPIPVAGR